MSADRLQRFLFDDTQVRGEITQLEDTYQEVLSRHDYPEAVEHLLGELLAACALLTATIKLDGILSVEIRGQGPLSLLMAESNPGSGERAHIKANLQRVPASDPARWQKPGVHARPAVAARQHAYRWPAWSP